MRGFIEDKIDDERQSGRLNKALSGSYPFRRFKDCLLDMRIEQLWYDYRQLCLEEYVREIIDEYEQGFR